MQISQHQTKREAISMICVNINITMLNQITFVVSIDDEVPLEPFQFSNDFEGFHSLSLILNNYD